MRVWHDDIREAPVGWTWARTNDEAKKLLQENEVEVISLDHDLGLEHIDPKESDAIYMQGDCPNGSGLDLVKWMCEQKIFPARIIIHSWNSVGAAQMQALFKDHGVETILQRYEVRR